MSGENYPALRSPGLERLWDLLRLLAALRAIREPLTSPEGLKQAIELVLELAGVLGLDPRFIERLRAIAGNEEIFQLALALVRYLFGLLELEGDLAGGRVRLIAEGAAPIELDARSFLEWLPFILQLLDFLRRLRQGMDR